MNKIKFNGFYLFVFAFVIGMLVVTFQYFRGSANSNIGITQAREYRISSEKPGVIKGIYVSPGQEVKAGELLVEVENPSLEIELVKLTSQIDALKKEREEKATLVKSKIAYMKAEAGIRNKDLESEIEQIISEVELNRQLTDQFVDRKDNPSYNIPSTMNPQELKKGSLEEMRKLNKQALQIQIEDLVKTHSTEMLMLTNAIDLKERELELMKTERERLRKYATTSGIVESVFVRAGEEVQAYTPFISLNPKSPNAVVAYIVGPKGRELSVGEKVKVISYNHKKIYTEGEVIGSGAFNALPEILQLSTAVKAFGREVFIKIPDENPFAPGEKVLVR